MNCAPAADVRPNEIVKRPKLFRGVWDDRNAYFPHLDGASVMIFEAKDFGGAIRFEATAENALAWTWFLCLHTDLRSELARLEN